MAAALGFAALSASPNADAAQRAQPGNARYLTPDGRIRIVGYNDMAEMLGAIVARVAAAHPELHFDLDLKSTKAAPAALISGTSLLAPMGAEMQLDDRVACRAAWGSDPIEIRVAHDSLKPGTLSSPTGVLVARGNPLRRIDIRMLRRAFSGGPGTARVTRWGQLGAKGSWAANPIHPVALAADTAIGRFVLHGPLGASGYAADVDAKRQSRDVAASVSADPLALGLANLNFAGPSVRALAIIDDKRVVRMPTRTGIQSGHYPLDRYLLIYVRRDSDGGIDPIARTVLESILSPAGQAIIRGGSRNYIPLNSRERALEQKKLQNIQ